MTHHQRILEVTINSARNLPPMSKLLRTFVAAWVNPETKLTTRVDLHGHTNPVWNCKLVFRVDDHFLLTESSTITMEIYNVVWLRDLPMGTTRLKIGQLLRNTNQKNQSMQNISLPIRRSSSSGQPQGSLNVSVNVVGGFPTPTSPPKTESTSPSNTYTSKTASIQASQQSLHEKFEAIKMETNPRIEQMSQTETTNKIIFSRSNSIKDKDKYTTETEISPMADSTVWIQQKSGSDTTKSRVISSNDSLFSAIKPLPSEVALDFKKGCYYQSSGASKFNNVFENWTESNSTGINSNTLCSKSGKWEVNDRFNILEKDNSGVGKEIVKKKSGNGKGIMSCFGNACGFQCKIFCGSKGEKKRRKNKYESKSPVFATAEQNLRRLYF